MTHAPQGNTGDIAMQGRFWVWMVDGFGLALAAGLIAAATGAPALKQVAGWLMMALPFAGLAMVAAGDRRLLTRPAPAGTMAARTIVITPRSAEARNAGKIAV